MRKKITVSEQTSDVKQSDYVSNKVQAPVVQTLDSAIKPINHYSVAEYEVSNCAVHWIEIHRLDRVIHLLNNWGQVGKMLKVVRCA